MTREEIIRLRLREHQFQLERDQERMLRLGITVPDRSWYRVTKRGATLYDGRDGERAREVHDMHPRSKLTRFMGGEPSLRTGSPRVLETQTREEA